MKRKLSTVLFLTLMVVIAGCRQKQPDLIPITQEKTYEYLPENLVAWSDDGKISARYVDPVTRYTHGILGDKVEGGGLLVTKGGKHYYYKLDEKYVFEDLKPRLCDLDHDGDPEFVVIQTSIISGASVSVYKIISGKLKPSMQSAFIGTPYRWLNIAAIDDLDNDGNVEIAWVETPHIGGVLKIARVTDDSLVLMDQQAGLSNHQIGLRNLCLSVITLLNGEKRLYVPDDPHQSIIGFCLKDDQLTAIDTLLMPVDPSIPLFMQYDFQNRLEDTHCIYIPFL